MIRIFKIYLAGIASLSLYVLSVIVLWPLVFMYDENDPGPFCRVGETIKKLKDWGTGK